MFRRLVVSALGATLLAAVIASSPASASVTGLKYSTDLRVVVAPPSVGTNIGKAHVARVGNGDSWNANVQVKNVPAGTYNFAVTVGTDLSGDGLPDSFTLTNLCNFSSNGKGTTGCAVNKVSLGRTDLGKFANADVVQTGAVSFLKATGTLQTCRKSA